MAKLPGWSFMLVGVFMMGYSMFIESKQPTANLAFFFWVGIAILIFGFVREVRSRTKKTTKDVEHVGPPFERKDHPPQPKHPAQHAQAPHATHQHVRPMQHPSHPYSHAKTCPRCHTQGTLAAKHCHACGYQFY